MVFAGLSSVNLHRPNDAEKTTVVMLGTGTPQARAEASGPSVAIVAGGQVYLADAGPGVVRWAAAAAEKGIAELRVQNLKTVFITHLHSDRTLGLPDLIFSPWVLRRAEPVEAYGLGGAFRARCAVCSRPAPGFLRYSVVSHYLLDYI